MAIGRVSTRSNAPVLLIVFTRASTGSLTKILRGRMSQSVPATDPEPLNSIPTWVNLDSVLENCALQFSELLQRS